LASEDGNMSGERELSSRSALPLRSSEGADDGVRNDAEDDFCGVWERRGIVGIASRMTASSWDLADEAEGPLRWDGGRSPRGRRRE